MAMTIGLGNVAFLSAGESFTMWRGSFGDKECVQKRVEKVGERVEACMSHGCSTFFVEEGGGARGVPFTLSRFLSFAPFATSGATSSIVLPSW